MAIDENKIKDTIEKLKQESIQLLNKNAKIMEVIMILETIKQVEKPVFDSKTGHKTKDVDLEMPLDPMTHEPMTSDRRQEIYTKAIAMAQDLLK